MANFIELKNVTKIFGTRKAQALQLLQRGIGKEEILKQTGATVGVNQVSLTVKQGELFVLMGLSGSGKSTLLRCLNRLVEPTSGLIRIDDTDILSLSKKDLLRFRQTKMAMVFQHFALLPHRTVVENVAFGLELQNVSKADRLRIAREKLSLVGLEEWADYYPEDLSGGMQQRVGLARALANDPDILLMDEAFSALDPLIREDMQTELLQLQHRLHKTVVFITHDLNEALRLGDRIALMKDGQIIQCGTPDDIVSNPANEYVARFVRGVDLTKVLVAADVMKRPSPLLRLKDGPRVALRTLRDAGLSSGFVIDDARTLQGIVSVDALVTAVAEKKLSVSECSLEDVTPVRKDTSLDALLHRIVHSKYPLPVVDDKARLEGLILKSSILEALTSQGGEADAAATSTR
ncbi:quaternary amine ABC transporter ATP-binding protein [Alicyclobacillus pomorum]|jgi:glycine betaine/proline transport system ATP-binding protein|uniref:quaternary amine ABC transporter ATP-binding protein n=1 Tax=Alicyclobacillus pomorum TaxID=204470 RepID=UPI0004181799|nr:glycine betaine/L-proline ABC transporter ATP-binding protein [Alicyclobacillus pomorum]